MTATIVPRSSSGERIIFSANSTEKTGSPHANE
jgi:hypothetical protein